jgi:hypothetical protein
LKHNPYVGPRPYEREDRHNFYGREREARELRALIVAEREVLFYAQSGAGKTSLLNAMVIPTLEEKGFQVLPVARVGSELPPEIDPSEVDNVYVLSTVLTLVSEDVPHQTLRHHTLCSLLEASYPAPEDAFETHPLVLIFDQFEELFTAHRERWQDAHGFFVQVREVLDTLPHLGVVFAMREDHVAEMDPYISLFPRRLRARFRMERLGQKGALAAVEKPALNAGCPFDSGVAQRLVDNLRLIKVRQHGSRDESTIEGPFIEPVQLQVVCQRLWENLPAQQDHAIQWEEVEEYGNIDRALTDFYESALDTVQQETDVGERQLRQWFGEQLITPMSTRGLALRGVEDTAGLPNPAVDVLERLHLIRGDVRAGARWYELIHDRLIEPILASNRAWQEEHQNSLTLGARAWLASNRDPKNLLRGDLLKEIQTQAHPDELTEIEREFINVSAEVARRETAQRLRLVLLGATVLTLILAVLTGWALVSANRASIARDRAQAGLALAEAQAVTAQAERDSAATARAELADTLEENLTAQAAPAEPTTASPTDVAMGPTPIASFTPGRRTPLPQKVTPTFTAPPTPDREATATIAALQEQLIAVRATQTTVARDSLPFVQGITLSFGGAKGDYLLKDPYDEKSGIVWVPVGTGVTVLGQGKGSTSYGSGVWYFVSLIDPETSRLTEGWLPSEVVGPTLLRTAP